MEFGGAPPKCGGGIQINAYMVSRQLRRWVFGKFHDVAQFSAQVLGKGERSTGFVIAVKLLGRPLPAVAFVCNQALQNSQCGSVAVLRRRILDQARKRRDSIEAYLFG